ncbi:MAG: RNB domain-containing ribonuclease, partial [Clostridia bacterium]|nr:RNB domain-containing ribonuclease [Clostridia bacterium]
MGHGQHKHLKSKRDKTFTGTVQGSDKGYVFITPDEDFGHDFFVPKKSVNGAYHGDKVQAVAVRGTRDEASILKIIQRADPRVIGTLVKSRQSAYVYPDNVRQPKVFIPLADTAGAKDGDKVVSVITSYPKGKAPGGKVIEVLGEEGDFDAEELSIIRSYALEEEFPEAVIKEAEDAAKQPVNLKGRMDLRSLAIITIDGEDTRDIDDGVSLSFENGKYVLGVHIADVSNYVLPRTALDDNAYGRGTSVYFPDRVLPMLPKALSNGACSLNEGELR